MVQAYNFLAGWQLFPEKCVYEFGIVPKSGNYKIESILNGKSLQISMNWITVENEAYYVQFSVVPDGSLQPCEYQELADTVTAVIPDTSTLIHTFYKNEAQVLSVLHRILSNGFLELVYEGITTNGAAFVNKEVYHKQMSVLPYASSVGSVAIQPTKQGMIKHKALTAMEEQTNMQLEQIKQQIELLARQAQEIRKRRELSLMIYDAQINFKPQIGQVYHLYEKKDGNYLLSLVAPREWAGSGPFKQFVASVQLLADHTWVEVA
ncbi:DUF2452 domain-containing protein [Hydrotalea flava]|uniref:DUF2452 domain-containing protein n=1 Tax=Hydrotalea flava TaxID=714549 RepID=UPI000AE5C4AA|nr:DUF2452 domain-containing protein [Hydrotalea flava]